MGERVTTPSGEFRVVDDVPSAFGELVAEHTVASLTSPVGSPRFRLVLSGGSTARHCYENLAKRSDLDWSSIECLVGDERCVPADDADANQAMIREALVERVTPRPRFLPMDCSAPPKAYEAVVAESAHLDLVHLGLGPDGHTASLFPGSAALDAPPEQLVAHNVDPSGRNPHERLTLTFGAISRARLVVFTVAGTDKHEALQRVLHHADLPASRVRAERVIWLCDREAVGSEGLPKVSP